MSAVLFLLLQDVLPAADAIGDALVPIGGAALIGLCLRLAVTAYKDSAAAADRRTEACAAQLAATMVAQHALTAEVKATSDGQRERGEWIKGALTELLDHARRGQRG